MSLTPTECKSERAFAATVLAAGQGSRLGGCPKAAIMIDGLSVLERLATALHDSGINATSVVIGPYLDQLLPLAQRAGLDVIEHTVPSPSLEASQRLAIRHHVNQHPTKDLMLVLGDLALLTAADIAKLLTAWHDLPQPETALAPLVEGVRGHPLLLSWELVMQIHSAPEGIGVREWLTQHPGTLSFMPSSSVGYTSDIDTPVDFAKLEAALHPMRLTWPTSKPGGAKPR